MEAPTHYYEQNIFCLDPLHKTRQLKTPINGLVPPKFVSSPVTEFHPSNPHSVKCQEIYIQNVAGNLHFSKDVVKDRGLASLSYQEWDSKDVYNASNVIPQRATRILKIQPKLHKLEQRHHCVRHAETSGAPIKFKAKSCVGFGNSFWKKPGDERRCGSSSYFPAESLKPNIFLTEEATLLTPRTKTYQGSRSASRAMSDNSEVLLKGLPKPTAQRIVGHQIQSKEAKERLSKYYGLTNSTDLINEENTTFQDKPEDHKVITEEPKPETLLPVFYKLPGYIAPQKQAQEVGAKNKTAEYLAIKHFDLPPPLRLQDLMNPKAGKHVYTTENDFERELYSGSNKIIYQKDPKQKNCIVMDSSSTYEKHLQQSVPRSYREWMSSDGQTGVDRLLRPNKGVLRWVALPTAVGDKIERSPQKDTSANLLSDKKPMELKPGPLNRKQVLQNMVSQWRSAWLLSAPWKEATVEQLTRDLGNVHNSHKISALVTIASSAIEAPQQIAFPAEILDLVSNALQEEDDLVRMAAALCQYLIRDVSEEARKIMFKSLESGTDADSWAAAQCLALEGNHNYLVIKRILEQMFASTSKETEEQALYMLHELSKHTSLIHAMLGEGLNSGNWGERVMSCKALSLLKGNISQGVKDKLSHLMWNDWSPAVRGAAAKALGKLDQGKEVHDQIRKHLESDSWKTKVEALTLIGMLQIMTAQLLPGFLQCFEDDFSAVRRQACRTAGLLRVKDDMVMDCLYQIIQNDPVWKIKAHAIKALGKIGHITPRMKDLMLWAVRVEEPGVRIEAYRCIATLNLCDYDVQHALQDRLMLETHELASREVKQTLTALNMAHKGNQEMISQVKHELSKLCQKEVLFPKVLKMDQDLASGQTERTADRERVQHNTPDWKHKTQEEGFIGNIVGKALSGHSCPSAISGIEYASTDSELQVLMENESRPVSHQTVNTAHIPSGLSTTTTETRQSTNTFRSNLKSKSKITFLN